MPPVAVPREFMDVAVSGPVNLSLVEDMLRSLGKEYVARFRTEQG